MARRFGAAARVRRAARAAAAALWAAGRCAGVAAAAERATAGSLGLQEGGHAEEDFRVDFKKPGRAILGEVRFYQAKVARGKRHTSKKTLPPHEGWGLKGYGRGLVAWDLGLKKISVDNVWMFDVPFDHATEDIFLHGLFLRDSWPLLGIPLFTEAFCHMPTAANATKLELQKLALTYRDIERLSDYEQGHSVEEEQLRMEVGDTHEKKQANKNEPRKHREGDNEGQQILKEGVVNKALPRLAAVALSPGFGREDITYQPAGESVVCPQHVPPQCGVCVRRPLLSFSSLLDAQPNFPSPVPVVDIDGMKPTGRLLTMFENLAALVSRKKEGISTWSKGATWEVRWFTEVLRPNKAPIVLPRHTPHVFLSLGWATMPGARGSFAFRFAFRAPGGSLHGCVESPGGSPGLASQESRASFQPLARLDLDCLGKAAVPSVAVVAWAQIGNGSSRSHQPKMWPWCAARSLHVRLIRGGHWAAEAPGGGPVPAVRDAEEVHAYLPLTGEDYCGLDAGDMLQVATVGRSAAGGWHFARNVQKIKAEVGADPYREPEPYRPPPLPPMGNLPPQQQQQHQQELDVATMYMNDRPALRATSAHFYRN